MPSNMSQYKQVMDMLNDAQKAAVETIEGPVMVVAGPGTGKTHVLAARIAHILHKTDTPPYAILALTFTESAAVNMRERVVSMIGKEGYYVNIMTFHSFCSDVIKSHPEYFSIERGSEALNDLERYELFQQLIENTDLDILKPLNMPMFYIRDIMQAISNLKREGVSPKEFKKIIHEEYRDIEMDEELTKTELKRLKKIRDKNEELASLYEGYQKELRKRLRFDFDDMIALVVEAFKNEELLLREYQEKLHYFLVDEYQDTNTAQNTVVELLASFWGEDANVFVVGDPNQSIYRFQGASIENTLNFARTYPNANIITLGIGYRCTQLHYDAAHAVITNNKLTQEESTQELHEAVTQKLTIPKDADKPDNPVTIAELPSQTLELVYIAETITSLIKDGVPAEEIAVLYRNNSDAIELQRVLEKWAIPYEIEGGENILEAEMVRQLLQYMHVVHDVKKADEDEKLFEIMAYDWTNIDPVLAMKIGRAAGKAKTSIADLIHQGHDAFMKYHGSDDVSPIEFQEAVEFMNELEEWVIRDGKLVFVEWFEKLAQESGYLDYILEQENKVELLTNLNSLFREVKALVYDQKDMKLKGFLQAIATMQDHGISIFAEDLNVQEGVVHLSTVHKAKGREWRHVFLVHCIDGKWGNGRYRDMIPLPSGLLENTDISKKERNEDDRRLFYVALTRAIANIYITYPETIVSDHRTRDVTSSMFIEEIPEDLKELTKPRDISDKSVEHLETLMKPEESQLVHVSEEEFFRDIVKDFKLSVTALNTYLRDIDDFIQNVLLRVPRAKPAPMAFGTAVHHALEQLYRAKQQDREYTKEYFLQDFESSLRKELMTEEDFGRRLEKGKKYLSKYYDQYVPEMKDPLYVEHFIGYGMSKAVLGDIELVGRIDRIDLLEPDEKTVRVIDYKTGRQKSKNQIEGKTASANLSERERELPESIRGPYKRQLLFYKLLTDLDLTFNYTTVEGMFDFVQPRKSSGSFVQRNFVLDPKHVDDLKKLITDVMGEIRRLKFLDTTAKK